MEIFSGVSLTFILNIPDPVNSFQIPAEVQWVMLKNTGAFPIQFNFDDDGPTDFWTLDTIAPGNIVGPIRVQGGSNFNTNGVGGASTLAGIAWG